MTATQTITELEGMFSTLRLAGVSEDRIEAMRETARTEAADFRIDQQVTATIYGERRTGRIVALGQTTIVTVKWDESGQEQWMHADSLQAI